MVELVEDVDDGKEDEDRNGIKVEEDETYEGEEDEE